MSAASFALAPAFVEAPEGGPNIGVERIRGVLRGASDSTVAEAAVEGDSAILRFERVQVRGDSSTFELEVQAFDSSDVLVFQSQSDIQVQPGDNAPAQPELEYAAPDANVDSLDVAGSVVPLAWLGAAPGNTRCLNRAADAEAQTQHQLTVQGFASGAAVAGVRVGWTSRDTTIATVSASGLVQSRCSNRSTYVVARTFTNEADSVLVSVTAPAFTLLMDPDSVSIPRGGSDTLSALVVDENGNAVPAAEVSWHTSDPTRATVNQSGVVQAFTNGRVQITASSGGRTTVAIVQVETPKAARLVVVPGVDTAAVGQHRVFFAKAFDASNRVIGDATGFEWYSSHPDIASVNASTGVVQALALGDAFIVAKLDGKKDSIPFNVAASRPPGSIESRVIHAATESPLAGASITGPGPASGTTSGPDGTFVLGGLQPGDNVTVSLDGYVSITLYDAPVYPNQTLRLPDAPMIPTSTSPGSMTGSVKHALTQSGVSGIAVNAYTGINAGPSPLRPFATPVATVSTTTNGSFTINNLGAGTYTLIFSGEGYSEMVSVGVVFGGLTTAQDAVLLPPATSSSGIAIVLTWGQCGETHVACDLDLHLTGPRVDAGRFHVYQGDKRYLAEGDTVAALDLDDLTGPGPEVIGLRASAAPGAYRLYVHNYSGRSAGTSRSLADSSFARVDVYQNNRVIGTFFPPSGVPGTLWKVFEYDGARLTPKNEIVHQEDAAVLPMIVGPIDPSAEDLSRIFDAVKRPKK
ncbi:MAG: carboxypeptidase regulatory-like domain-containing protein [Gemmatimonadaceae bacterium]